jgi:hypothetical protein
MRKSIPHAQDKEALSEVGRVFDLLCAAFATAAAAASGGTSQQLLQTAEAARGDWYASPQVLLPPSAPAVSGDEMFSEVFQPLLDAEGCDAVYVRAVIMEYLRAADAAGIASPVALINSVVESLKREHSVHQLPLWRPLLMPPVTARGQGPAVAVARSVSRAAADAGDAAADAFCADVSHRCMPHDAIVRDMLASGQVLAALRYARRQRVESVPPALFMEAAASSKNLQIFASAFQFCAQHVPGFSGLPDYASWKSRLAQM